MVTHAKDLTAYGGPKEAEIEVTVNEDAPESPGGTKPNQFTKWGGGSGLQHPGVRVKRPVDMALKEAESLKQTCGLCGWSTTSKEAWISHNRKSSDGQILCERQRSQFKPVVKCSRCGGEGVQGETPCGECGGKGFKPKEAGPAGLDADALAEKIGQRLDRTLREGFGMMAQAIAEAMQGRHTQPPKQESESDARAGDVPEEPEADGPLVEPEVGQPERPVEDRPEEPA